MFSLSRGPVGDLGLFSSLVGLLSLRAKGEGKDLTNFVTPLHFGECPKSGASFHC